MCCDWTILDYEYVISTGKFYLTTKFFFLATSLHLSCNIIYSFSEVCKEPIRRIDIELILTSSYSV